MQKKKKGFTLVELLVVIAILAILASVSVVGYLSFTNKAKLSNDQTMVKMINDNLQAASIEQQPNNASEALTTLYSLGFSGEKLKSYSEGYHYVYNLEENKFYLCNDNDRVIYPTEKDITSMWALYRDNSDDVIQGVNKYVALDTINNQELFNLAFKDGGKLELNNFLLNVNNETGQVVEVSNGSISHDSTGFLENETTKKQVEFDNASALDNAVFTSNTVTVDSFYITSTKSNDFINEINRRLGAGTSKKIVIKNTTFKGINDSDYIWWDSRLANADLTIENCIFTNFGSWAFVAGSSSSNIVYKIKNNLFVNTERGINVESQNSLLPGSVIEGNTFKLGKTSKANAIQFSKFTEEKVNTLPQGKVLVSIKNNKMTAGNAFVIIHDSSIKSNLIPTSFEKVVSFENNSIGFGIKRVILDPDLTPEFLEKGNQFVSVFEKIIK